MSELAEKVLQLFSQSRVVSMRGNSKPVYFAGEYVGHTSGRTSFGFELTQDEWTELLELAEREVKE